MLVWYKYKEKKKKNLKEGTSILMTHKGFYFSTKELGVILQNTFFSLC